MAISADDEELSGEWTGDNRAFANSIDLHLADLWKVITPGCAASEMHVGGTHLKYGLPDGGIVVARPDGYGMSYLCFVVFGALIMEYMCLVGMVVPLSERGWKALETYFDGFLQANSIMAKL